MVWFYTFCTWNIEIPVLPTIVGRVTFQQFDPEMKIAESKFFIPRDYKVCFNRKR